MAGEGYPSGGGGTMTATQLLLRLTGAATLSAGAMLYGAGTASLSTLTIGAANTVLTSSGTAPAWSTSLALTSTIASKQASAAGISLDHNSATGNFTLRLSPANLTANRRATFPDADFTVAGLSIAQTFSAANIFSSTVELNTSSNGLTISKATGTTLVVSSTNDSSSAATGCATFGGGIGMAGSLYSVKTINGGLAFQFTNAGTGNAFTALTAAEVNGSKYSTLYHINDSFTSSGAYQAGGCVFEHQGSTSAGIGLWPRDGGPVKLYDTGGTARVTFSNAGLLTLAATSGTNAIRSTTPASAAFTGALVIGDGSTTAQNVSIGLGSIYAGRDVTAGGSLDIGVNSTISASFLGVTIRDAAAARGLVGYKAGGPSTSQIPFQILWTDTVGAAGSLVLAARDTASTVVSIHAGSGVVQSGVFSATGLTLPVATGTTFIVSSTTDATSSTAAAMTCAGGGAWAKGGYFGTFLNIGTNLTIGEAGNIIVGTSTGTKIGTATTQKLAFFNSTPIVQPANTTDLRAAIINLGLLATGGATPLNLNGGILTAAQTVISTGTITADQPAINATQTWNAGGVTFTGWKLNVTNTASASASLLLDLQVASVSQFNVGKAGDVTALGGILSNSPTAGIGYGAGAGGYETQLTSKATAVTLNKIVGQVITANDSLAAGAKVTFTLTNSTVAPSDIVCVAIKEGGTANAYRVSVAAVASGSCAITLENITAGSLGENITISFAVLKGTSA